MTSNEDTIRLFDNETKNLDSQINAISGKDVFSIPEIIQAYYLATNVDSLATMMADKFEENPSVLQKVQSVKKLISNFNLVTHKKILQFLSHSIEEITGELQSHNPQKKTKEEIELDAKKFETLREMMSTKEFVEQYDRGVT